MDFITHNDLLWCALCTEQDRFQRWVIHMALDMDFDWADGPLDAPIHPH